MIEFQEDGFANELREFAAAVREGGILPLPGAEGRRALALALACYRATARRPSSALMPRRGRDPLPGIVGKGACVALFPVKPARSGPRGGRPVRNPAVSLSNRRRTGYNGSDGVLQEEP